MAKIILNVELNSDKVPNGIKKIRSEIASLGQEFGKIKNAKDVTDGVKALTTHYEKLAKAANEVVKVYNATWKLPYKEIVCTINNAEELYDWYNMVTAYGYTINGEYVEGFVLQDMDDHMVKVKT